MIKIKILHLIPLFYPFLLNVILLIHAYYESTCLPEKLKFASIQYIYFYKYVQKDVQRKLHKSFLIKLHRADNFGFTLVRKNNPCRIDKNRY